MGGRDRMNAPMPRYKPGHFGAPDLFVGSWRLIDKHLQGLLAEADGARQGFIREDIRSFKKTVMKGISLFLFSFQQ